MTTPVPGRVARAAEALHCPVCDRHGPLGPVGVQIPGVYDGVLLWECSCGHAWPRFTAGTGAEADRLHALAVEVIAHGKASTTT